MFFRVKQFPFGESPKMNMGRAWKSLMSKLNLASVPNQNLKSLSSLLMKRIWVAGAYALARQREAG